MGARSQAEEALIERIKISAEGPLQGSAARIVSLGIGDDAALFRPKLGQETILSCDWFLEGAHFLRGKHPPDSVGWKCLARALSDIAAMGGTPRCFLLSLALPESHTGSWLDGFLAGLRRAARKFRCILAGGDTTRHKKILINVTVVGEVRAGRAVLRSGARPGDRLYVSGRLGEAELGLRILEQSRRALKGSNPRLRKHLYPEPRLALGQWLTKNHLVTAMMDLSDGLSTDLSRLCAASGVGAHVEIASIPSVKIQVSHHPRGMNPLQLALHGGDDYELLFTVSHRFISRIPKSFHGLHLTAIGEITRSEKLVLAERDGSEHPLVPGGWDPFRKKT